MNGKNKLLAVLLVLMFFSAPVFAHRVSVSIAPKNPALDVIELYTDEAGELEITVLNIGEEAVEGLSVMVSVEGTSIALIKNGFAFGRVIEKIDLLEAGASTTFLAAVKPLELSMENQPITAGYGFETFDHSVSTYVKIIESPLEIVARLEKSALDLGEGSKVSATFKNTGVETIRNIEATLALPTGIEGKSMPLAADYLAPGESIADREFLFEVDPSVSGEKKLVLLIGFEDAKGRHVLEKDFVVEVQNRTSVLYFLVIAIVALIVVALYIKRKPSKSEKPLEQPEVKELEGKDVKTLPVEGNEIKK